MGASLEEIMNRCIRFFLYLLIFWLPYSIAVIESSVITATILWLVKRSIRAQKTWDQGSRNWRSLLRAFSPVDSPLNAPIGFFLLVSLVCTLRSVSWGHSWSGLMTKTLEWFVIYFLVLEVFDHPRSLKIALGIFLFTSLSTIIDGLFQFHIFHKDIFAKMVISDGRATGPFPNANQLAGYLTMAIPLALALWAAAADRRWRWAAGLAWISGLWSLMTTFSRGGWLAVLGGFVFIFFLFKRFSWPVILGLAMTILVCLGIFFTRFEKEIRLEKLEKEKVLTTAFWRKDLWADSLRMLMDRPLFGYGPNTYMPAFYEYVQRLHGPGTYEPTYAHNCYLQLAVEYGILGLIAFLWILATLFFQTFASVLKPISDEPQAIFWKAVRIGLSAGLLAFLLHSFVDTHFFSLRLSVLLWLMIGLLVAVTLTTNRSLNLS